MDHDNDSHNQNYGMVGQWNKLGCETLLKSSTLVVRWAGFEDTHHLEGPWYDTANWDYGMVGQWNKLGHSIC